MFGGCPDDLFEQSVEACLGSQIRESDLIASYMWAAMANIEWTHVSGEVTIYSFREAGSLVARIRGEGDYMDWYCSADYGTPQDVIAQAMATQGWTWKPFESKTQPFRQMDPMSKEQASSLLQKRI